MQQQSLINNINKQQKREDKKELIIVAISDTHGKYKQLQNILNIKGDIFIHAGDFTYYGREDDFYKFFNFLEKLQFKHKIVIAGNHQISLDNGCISEKKKQSYLAKYKCSLVRDKIILQLKKRCIYLEHQAVQVEGIKIFGSPYSPYYVGNAFQYQEKYQKIIWKVIPNKTDILVTHCPPLGILDQSQKGKHGGSGFLGQIVSAKSPKYHIFGHIHQSAGKYKKNQITYLNVAKTPTFIKF